MRVSSKELQQEIPLTGRQYERRSTLPVCTGISMRTQVDRSSLLPMRIPSVAAISYGAAAIAAFVAWTPIAMIDASDDAAHTESSPMPGRSAGASNDGAVSAAVGDTTARTTCPECGVVESVREIDTRGERAAESTRSYEITIVFQDGSREVFSESTPRTWRSGTRVKVVR
jgi:hypothetical protein